MRSILMLFALCCALFCVPVLSQELPSPRAEIVATADVQPGTPVLIYPAGQPVVTPPAPEPSGFMAILQSPVIATMLISLIVGVMKWQHDKNGFNASLWGGLVANCYNAAEQTGLLNKWSGAAKLAHAMEEFDKQFTLTFGHPPTGQQRAQMRNDLALMAYDDDSSLRRKEIEARMRPVNLTPIASV